MAEKLQRNARQAVGLFVPTLGVSVLCVVAVVAQSAGLFSVVNYVTSREGWEAQKSQFAEVKSEWEAMSLSTKEKIDAERKQQLQVEQDRVSAEKSLETVLQNLAKAKGEFDSIETAASYAEDVLKRTQAQEQSALDNVQLLERQVSELTKSKSDIQTQVTASQETIQGIDARIAIKQATLESQNRELQGNGQSLSQMDAALKTTRDNLRKASDDLVKANEDLATTLAAMNTANAASESSKNIKVEVDGLRSEKAKLSGEVEALVTQKLNVEKEIATADSRLVVANSRLAEYLEKWNNRENLTREITDLLDRVKNLKQTESDTLDNMAKMNDQSVQLTTRVRSLLTDVQAAETQLAELRKRQQDLIKELLELQKLKQQVEVDSGGNVGPPEAGGESND